VSVARNLQAIPALLRAGYQDALAYRAEMFVWILSTTMPLVMLAMWHSVASEAPVGRMGPADMTRYFLCTFIVRQLTGCWISFIINGEIKDGTLALRLLRPVHPLLGYATLGFAHVPLRALLSVPLAVVALVVTSGIESLPRSPAMLVALLASVVLGFSISLLTNLIIGTLALFLGSSQKLMDAWTAVYFVLSGYLIPTDIMPPWLRTVAITLPFRYQLGVPVEIMTGAHDVGSALDLCVAQLAWVVAMGFALAWVWRRGVRRFEAYGG
jgi:ABC-2 type transport system permease protein